MASISLDNVQIIGVIAGLISCIIFLIFHQLTISNIWFSSPFMLIISGIAGYLLVKLYENLITDYSFTSWALFNLYFIVMLTGLGLVSRLIFTPKFSSEEIINDTGGPPPPELITGALPLTFVWIVITAFIVIFVVNKSFDGFWLSLLTAAVLLLSLGLNISILGFVEVTTQHQYLVQKFLLMNIGIGVGYFGVFAVLKPILT